LPKILRMRRLLELDGVALGAGAAFDAMEMFEPR
jgi:hypothetical protein